MLFQDSKQFDQILHKCKEHKNKYNTSVKHIYFSSGYEMGIIWNVQQD